MKIIWTLKFLKNTLKKNNQKKEVLMIYKKKKKEKLHPNFYGFKSMKI